MNIFDRKVKDGIPTPVEVGNKFKNEMNSVGDSVEENVEVNEVVNPVEDLSEQEVEIIPETPKNEEIAYKQFKIKYGHKKYKVIATSKEEAEEKIKRFFEIKQTDEIIDKDISKTVLSVKDIFNASLAEIHRIVTVAHPEAIDNTYDRWVAVITEELGEIVHEVNDEYEGKKPSKNTFVECIQLISATVLFAKQYANDHPEMFVTEEE